MIKILLADDHAIFREGLASLLKTDATLELVAEAQDGDEAWRLMQQHLPDVAILDISMPGLNGLEVASQLKKSGLPIRVVILTSYDDPTLALQANEAGVTGYILKENSFEELHHAIRTVWGGGRFMSGQVTKKLQEMLCFSPRKTLSPRENEVLALIAMGHTNKEIARLLHITPRTVDTHKTRLKEKLELHTIGELSQYAVRVGLIK
ncbi:MAG: response regulator transcription factor [Magnetococcales bacterium]|nr:response regulator transcription factor [Magnetococcales bacterium]